MRLGDACEILGIQQSATPEEAQKAYRKQALLHHPDRSSAPDATQKFQTIGAAWERVQRYHKDGRGDPPPSSFDDEDDASTTSAAQTLVEIVNIL